MQSTTTFNGTWQSDHSAGNSGTVQLDLPTSGSGGEFISKLVFTTANGCDQCFQLQGNYNKDQRKYYLMPHDINGLEGNFLISLSFYEHSGKWQGSFCRFGDLGRLILDSPINCVKVEVTCTGCLNGYANQLGHMDPGGCLYDENY